MDIYIDDTLDMPQPEPHERSMTCVGCGAAVSLDTFLEMACCLCDRCYEEVATFAEDDEELT